MRNAMVNAIIRKDLRAIIANKRMLSVMLIVPFMMAVVLPSIFILMLHFAPESASDFQALIDGMTGGEQTGDATRMILTLLMDSMMPIFFIMIPVMVASVMAASSFVGEKEKRTLETLLYCPLTLKEIFRAKILASFLMSMLVSVISFVAMELVVQVEIVLTTGSALPPGVSWLVVMLLLSPAVSLIAITVIVRGSAKAQTMEESQQRSALLVLPIVLLVVGQFAGLLLVNVWMLLGMGILFAAIALVLMNASFRKLNYETLLKT
ncbi:ABC transporter permease subunit [Eubacteriales bacterium OttesenSCG-928-A19]|nr:ABC transporter permease subunit [Eubacteriales bacterium OttesenSCG-928-A19]